MPLRGGPRGRRSNPSGPRDRFASLTMATTPMGPDKREVGLDDFKGLSRSPCQRIDTQVWKVKMNFDPAERLRTHFGRILGKQCFSLELIEILRLTRLIIEQQKWSKHYQTLSLYCNWVQHGKIDRHPQAWSVLEKINDILADHGSGDVSVVIREISRAFGLSLLRQEMLLLFLSKSIQTDIIDSLSNWRGFLGGLLDDLSHRPIRLPDKVDTMKNGLGREVFDRMVNRAGRAGWRADLIPRAVYITNRSNAAGEPGRPAGFYWNIRLIEQGINYAEMNGLLEFTETGNDFGRP